ncbi:MAG: phosphatase PAP2 family protein [Calditrichaceae bacterium]|jgi:undecaprenyl-diphosphatase
MIKTFNNSIQKFDSVLFLYISGLNNHRIVDRVFYVISKIGDGPLYIIVGISLVLKPDEIGLNLLFAGLLAFTIELPVYFIVKRYVKRLRPFEKMDNIKHLIVPPDKYSFPSGHTAAAFVMATVFSYHFPAVSPWLYLAASLIGFSRLYLRVHFPTDVMAGVTLGILSANISLWIIF